MDANLEGIQLLVTNNQQNNKNLIAFYSLM